MKICGFKNTRIHLEGASERDVMFFFGEERCFRVRVRVRVDTNPNPKPTLKQHSSFVKSCLLRIFLHVGSGNYMRKSIHYNNDKKEKKKKKNFHINYLSNTKHISNFPEA